MKVGSLCSGYGGLDLAIEHIFPNAQTTWFSEFNKFAAKIYETHWDAPNLGDLTKINWDDVEPVDILTGGYPCQPFSTAGNRKGQNDKRHLLPYIRNAISSLRPRIVFFENVRGHLSLGFDSVLQDLADIGYDATWSCVTASSIGATHKRERLFIVGYSQNFISEWGGTIGSGQGQSEETLGSGSVIADPSGNGIQKGHSESRIVRKGQQFDENHLHLANTEHPERKRIRDLQELCRRPDPRIDLPKVQWGKYEPAIRRWEELTRPAPNPIDGHKLSPRFVEWMMGLPAGWVTDVDISRSQQLMALGNGVVPQQAIHAYTNILANL